MFRSCGAWHYMACCGYKHSAPAELNPGRLKIPDDLPCRIRARSASYSTARVRAGATKIKPFDWGAVLRPTDQRAKSQKLIERLFAMMNVAATHSVSPLKIQWRDHLPRKDQLLQVRCVTAQDVDYTLSKRFTPRVPITVFQFVRRILNVD